MEAPVNESSPSNPKVLLFAFCCIGFVAGVGLALFTTWDACCGPSNNFGGDSGVPGEGVVITFAVDWFIAITLFALTFVQAGKLRRLQFGMAAILSVLPFIAKWAFDTYGRPLF
jgi:hypothetical protein